MKSMRQCLALLLALALCLSLLSGCAGKKNNPAQTAAASSAAAQEGTAEASAPAAEEAPAAASEAASSAERAEEGSAEESLAQETAAAASVEAEPQSAAQSPYDSAAQMDVTGVDFDALGQLDNTSMDYGFSKEDRDELNRPNGIYYYDRFYKDHGGVTHIDTTEKLIFLTMDEGYEAGHSNAILDTLKEKGVHVVFFITKQFYDEHPDLIQRMIDEGHIIGNHSCAHLAGGMPQIGAQAQYEDYKWLNDAVYEKFGYQMKLFRFPEGVSSPQSCELLKQMGYKSVFWSFAYRDFVLDDQMDPADALDQCLDQLHPGAIYLLHAVSATNSEILGQFIDGAREAGYEFGVFPVETAPALK